MSNYWQKYSGVLCGRRAVLFNLNAILKPNFVCACFTILLACLSSGCASRDTHESLDGTLWVQSSTEYKVLTRSIYKRAASNLQQAISDSAWTAALEQRDTPAEELPRDTAVILDIDETVLANTPFQGQMVRERSPYYAEAWMNWVDSTSAEPVPGALAFIGEAQSAGVAVIYVTNRRADKKAATIINLQKLGLHATPENVLCRGERPDWTSDKTSRRSYVAEDYRVLMLIGDNLNDFFPARLSTEERDRLAEQYSARWGRQWYLLPNPLYGSWESAIIGSRNAESDEETLRFKQEAVQGFDYKK
jgi:5'-nucleotidase (lipoprotein e(P4) family)